MAYVADALTEVLISNLARIRSLRVPSFAAVAPSRSSNDAPPETARKLGVELLIAGSITQVEPRLRFAVQVVDTEGRAVWKDEITRERSAMMSAQADLVQRLVTRFGFVLSADERRNLAQLAIDPQAEDAYLRGLALTLSAPAKADEAAASFRRAIDLAPNFGPAWAELAFAEMFLVEQSAPGDQDRRTSQIRELADRAIALDPTLGRSYAARGTVEFYYDWNLDKAEQTLRSGLEYSPSDGFIRQRLSMLLAARNRLPEAIDLGREGQRLEPFVPFRSTSLGTLYYYARQYDQAAAEMERALSINPELATAYFGLGRVRAAQGRNGESLAAIEQALGRVRYPEWLAEYARVLLVAGRRRDAQTVLDELRLLPEGATPYLDQEAHRAIIEGQRDRAFAILDQAISRHSLNVLWLSVDPRVDALRNDPRFTKLLGRIETP